MADIEPPSFSLGLDFDLPPPPPPPPPSKQTPSKPLEPEAPSFSLGLDFDTDPPPPPPPPPKPTPSEAPSFSLGLDFDVGPSSLKGNSNDDDDSSKWWVSDSEPDSPRSPRVNYRFRRLRRGRPSVVGQVARDLANSVEDEIEDFSEEDIFRTDPSRVSQHQTLNSSSKLPLSGCGVLKRPLDSTIHDRKKKQDSSLPPSTSVASNKGKSVFPDFTSSPLRKFQLIDSDSDSDDQTEGVKLKGNTSEVDLSKNILKNKINYGSNRTPQNQDLWKDFRFDSNVSVPTPVFDELLEEYYKDGKQKTTVLRYNERSSSGIASTSNDARFFQETDAAEITGLPCHSYFFHGDDRIRRLVRSRLPYFSPINVSGDAGNIPHNASSINYRGQFGATAKQAAGKNVNTGKSSKRAPKRNKKAKTVENSQDTTWVDPTQTTNTPQNAGKRRVRADGQSSGHWLNADNGKKVYVTRTGKELTGRMAYIRYKKENGGFTKTRKKRAPKKK